MFKNFPGRPDCDLDKPEYDGTCPRRGKKISPVCAKFLTVVGIFLKFRILPYDGGLFDQDLRFLVGLTVLSEEFKTEQLDMLQSLAAKFTGGAGVSF